MNFTEQKGRNTAQESAGQRRLGYNNDAPPLEEVRKRISYNPETGDFVWLKTLGRFARKGQVSSSRHNNGKGKEYLKVKVCGKSFLAHRLAWYMTTGEMPDGQIDHINGDGTDNRMSNLRVVDQLGNNKNLRRAKNNTSGRTGVHHIQNPNDGWFGKYKATGSVGNKTVNLGAFNTMDEAVRAREKWEAEQGYHENHGMAK